MSIEAMKQALEALENVYGKGKKCDAAITALQQALKQPLTDEPKWYHGVDAHGCNRFYHPDEVRPSEFNTPLYTAPPKREWVGLTQAEFEQTIDGLEDLIDCWQALEAKLRKKNT